MKNVSEVLELENPDLFKWFTQQALNKTQQVNLGCGPLTVTVGNEGLGWDSLLKMVHNPGGDWHPVRGATSKVNFENERIRHLKRDYFNRTYI